jgi:putative NADH-flavin reductase
MKVIVFGATGPTGRRALDEALAKGHEVTAFVRDPSKLKTRHERLRVVKGDAVDRASVENALAGQHGVLVCLGARNRSGKGWPPRDIDFVATRNILAGMTKHGVKRLVCMTGMGVGDSKQMKSVSNWVFTKIFMPLLLKKIFEAKEKQEEAIRASDRDWIIVRPTVLNDGPARGDFKVTTDLSPVPGRISRADVAAFMVEQLGSDRYLHQAPLIGG